MPTTVNILVKGLAVCFRDGKNWKIIFLCDDRHRLKFSYRKNGGTASKKIELRKRNRKIFFEVSDTQPITEPKGDLYDHIFNMNSLYAHRGKIKLKPAADVPATREMVTMTVQDAQLYTAEPQPAQFPSEKAYHIMVKDRPETETLIHIAARIVGAKIVLNQGGSLQVKGKDQDFPDIKPFPYENGTTYDLTFDNDCGNDCGEDDDFKEYYDLLYEDSGLEFVAGRPPLPGTSEVGVLVIDGNCDPIIIDPPPPPPG